MFRKLRVSRISYGRDAGWCERVVARSKDSTALVFRRRAAASLRWSYIFWWRRSTCALELVFVLLLSGEILCRLQVGCSWRTNRRYGSAVALTILTLITLTQNSSSARWRCWRQYKRNNARQRLYWGQATIVQTTSLAV